MIPITDIDPIKAQWQKKGAGKEVLCLLCPHMCRIPQGKTGRCKARRNENGNLVTDNYARITAGALDPVEKKPLYHFHPGEKIWSVGTFGCNLHCDFCQNWQISQQVLPGKCVLPQETARNSKGTLGIAFTYSEPIIWFEYVTDTARLVHDAGQSVVLVTNGYIRPDPLDELLEHADAMNIDVKAFAPDFYRRLCSAELDPVLQTVMTSVKKCHVELTMLVIPGENDNPKEIDRFGKWVRDNCGAEVPVHVSRYFPSWKSQRPATDPRSVISAAEILSDSLEFVYTGNLEAGGRFNDTVCSCGALLIHRTRYVTTLEMLLPDGTCGRCGRALNIVV